MENSLKLHIEALIFASPQAIPLAARIYATPPAGGTTVGSVAGTPGQAP